MESIKAGIRERALKNQLLSLELTVMQVVSVSPGFTRVTLEGPALADYTDPWAADAFKLLLPAHPGATVEAPQRGDSGLPEFSGEAPQPVLRAFTVRRVDAAARQLSFDVARHEHGTSIDWLSATRPGDAISLTGMRPEWALADGVHDHILIGDRSAVPAMASIIESLGAEQTVAAYVELPDPTDIALLPQHPNLTVHEFADITGCLLDTPPRWPRAGAPRCGSEPRPPRFAGSGPTRSRYGVSLVPTCSRAPTGNAVSTAPTTIPRN